MKFREMSRVIPATYSFFYIRCEVANEEQSKSEGAKSDYARSVNFSGILRKVLEDFQICHELVESRLAMSSKEGTWWAEAH